MATVTSRENQELVLSQISKNKQHSGYCRVFKCIEKTAIMSPKIDKPKIDTIKTQKLIHVTKITLKQN